MTAARLRRGWCPGVLQPMQTGDGLLVRLRLTGGRFSPATALVVAQAAQLYGNGQIDLSQRANLQLRGVSDVTLAPLTAMLAAARLTDQDERSESARNVIASPASDLDEAALIDAHQWAGRIEALLVDVAQSRMLPAKFGILIDDGGAWPLDASHADIRVKVLAEGTGISFRIGVAGDASTAAVIGDFAEIDVLAVVKRLCMALPTVNDVSRPKTKEDVARWLAAAELGARHGQRFEACDEFEPEYGKAVILRPAFGRIAHGDMAGLVACLDEQSQAEMRLTTAKAIIVGPLQPDEERRLRSFADKATHFLQADHPLRHVAACVGAPACGNATTDVRADALRLAPLLAPGVTLHVSGCSKGCASRAPADLVLVGERGLYKLGRKCKAGDLPADACRMSVDQIERKAFEHELLHA